MSCASACQPEPMIATVAHVVPRQVLGGDRVGGADPHALHHPVGADRKRRAVMGAEQQHEPDIAPIRPPAA